MTETLFITLISMLISILITPMLLRVFADFIPKDLHFNLLQQPYLPGFLFILTLLVTILAGFYPAMVFSKFKPVLVLKNQAYSRNSHQPEGLAEKGTYRIPVFNCAVLLHGNPHHCKANKLFADQGLGI